MVDNKKDLKDTNEGSTRRQILRSLASAGLVAGAAAAVTTKSALAQDDSSDFSDSPDVVGEFKGRTAFITGGARGIGFAAAESLARQGVNIVLYDVASQIPHVRYPLANKTGSS